MIRKQLAESDKTNVIWQTDLAVSYYKLSQFAEIGGQVYLKSALNILVQLKSSGRLAPEKYSWIAYLEEQIDREQIDKGTSSVVKN